MKTTRRGALGLAATTGAAVSVTACGGGEDQESGGGSGGTVRVPVADVPEEGGVVVEGVVVTQPTKGEYQAFDAACPHEGCSVREVTAKAIICPCHGSEFDPTSGDVTQGPAEEGLTARTVTVEGDQIDVS